ncbi:dynein heavy chain 6, axonemal-like [Ochotona curzoniae]|uniref:dynein heavy chain 6, axonemal-like n=1 Tax=Ochotona curzoniae TaxID=130825 RepID=UPI001B353CFD|nr:dynein heavy chain 6, axonemal-like [Ochotona curzoniae]
MWSLEQQSGESSVKDVQDCGWISGLAIKRKAMMLQRKELEETCDYLETKRMIFPRFYFLSTDELLAILAGSRNPESVQPHLVKCFENVKQLMICKQEISPSTIRMLMSAEGEGLVLHKKIHVRSAVEQWLANVEKSMFEALKRQDYHV